MIEIEREDGKRFSFGDVFKITSITGLGVLKVENITQKKAYGDGDVLLGVRIPSRVINIFADCVYNDMNTLERQTVNQFFNSNYAYKIHIDYADNPVWIECVLDMVDMPIDNINRKLTLGLSFYCSDPFFKSKDEFGKNLANVKPSFVFPLVSPIGSGFAFGVYEFAKDVFIKNDGNEPTTFKAIIQAEGLVTKFKISKNDREYVLFNQDLKNGDKLIIDFGKGTVVLNDNNAIHKLDRTSTFFTVPVGGTNIKYSAETGDNVVRVFIYYNKLFAGV